MPFTISHTAAVLPFRRYVPHRLDLLALVIGTMTPDFPYYWHDFILASKGHTFLGSLIVCLPIGLLAYYLVKLSAGQLKTICLPPFDSYFASLEKSQSKVMVVIFSILIGAWTHSFWDAFTHSKGSFVSRIPFLKEPLFAIFNHPVPIYSVLQHTSTLLGLALIAYALYKYSKDTNTQKSNSTGKVLTFWVVTIAFCLLVVLIQYHSHIIALFSKPAFEAKFVFYCVLAILRNLVLTIAAIVALRALLHYTINKRAPQ